MGVVDKRRAGETDIHWQVTKLDRCMSNGCIFCRSNGSTVSPRLPIHEPDIGKETILRWCDQNPQRSRFRYQRFHLGGTSR